MLNKFITLSVQLKQQLRPTQAFRVEFQEFFILLFKTASSILCSSLAILITLVGIGNKTISFTESN